VEEIVAIEPDAVRELERLRAERAAVRRLLSALARGEGLQRVLDEVVVAAHELCEGEHAQLYLREDEVFYVTSESGGQSEGLEYAREHPHRIDRTTVVGRVALTGDVVQIPDVLADAEYNYGGQAIVGFQSLLGVPIVLEGELIGALAVGRNRRGLFTDDQVGAVRAFADQAAVAIANARLLEAVERQRSELARFVAPQVAELLSSVEGERLLAGHRAYISCVFCDLRNFTSFAETAAPEELIELLAEYHQMIGELVPSHHGTLEHFAGDGVLIFFNDPAAVSEHQLEAVRFALAAQVRFSEIQVSWKRRGVELALGVGIEAGYATLGRIGYAGRYDYGALGPVVNLASRLSTHATGGQILVGPRVHAAIEHGVKTVPVGEVQLKGFGRPIQLYEVQGLD
jgi:class 3 adenylate cyclase